MTARTTPYGEWTSPVAPADLAGSPHYEHLLVDGDAVLWTRSDPDTGAVRLHRHVDGSTVVLAADHNVRSRVHEYGGGAVAAGAGHLLVVEFTDQRLHEVGPDATTTPVTDETGSRVRFADGRVADGDRLVCVRETHADDGVHNALVLVDLTDGHAHVLVDDHDFVAAPRLGPSRDGVGLVAWLAWDHPDMPWDGAAAWVGRLDGDHLVDATRVVGGDGVSVADLDWLPDGSLVASSDETGFWEMSRWEPPRDADGAPLPTAPAGGDGSGWTRTWTTSTGIDLGKPRWDLGHDMLAVVGDRVVVAATDGGVDRLLVVADDGTTTDLPGPAVWCQALAAEPGRDAVVAIEADRDGRVAVRRHGLDGSTTTLDEIPPVTQRPGDHAEARPVAVPVDGATTHAFLHPPANADHVGPDDALPPLVAFIHGGPTSHRAPVRTTAIAYWTTRGFAVVDVNYRGSSGFGRDYRRALWGRWGVSDVDDMVAVAAHLADSGVVDADRMAIRGGSAGGFTTLAVLTRADHPFACGTSFFGVADLMALARDTHKFESRYLDRLVGPLPKTRATYDERSPLSHVDELAVPLLVLQGLDDKVVPPAQSEVVVEAARERGVPTAYLAFEGEGHGFRRSETVVAWHEAELAFYGEVMGFTPAGDLPTVLG